MALPGELLGQFGVPAGQFQKAGMSHDPFGDKLQFIWTDTLAVVGSVLVSLEGVIRPIGGGAGGTLWFEGLLTEVATDHGIDLGDLLEDEVPLLLNGG